MRVAAAHLAGTLPMEDAYQARALRSLINQRSRSQSTSTQAPNDKPSVNKNSSNRKSIVITFFNPRIQRSA